MLTREQCRKADEIAIKHFRIPSIVLMENAGRNCAEKLLWHSPQSKLSDQAVVILCGPGNNGGDGFVIARHLYNLGVKVKVILFAPPEKYFGDARTNLNALSHFKMPVVQFGANWSNEKMQSVFAKVKRAKTTWVVDAMLGTGATGQPRTPMADAITLSNQMDVRRMSVDIPTGLDCDTGEPAKPTFKSDVTCSFIDAKIGFENEKAQPYLGVVLVVDIGAPDAIIAAVQ
ncbi:MAG: NAD(P)H-hydrate epimerase [Mariniblastus sp.]